MSTIKTQLKTIQVKPSQVNQLFILGNQIADFSENLLENFGLYSEEFIIGLNKSINDSENGELTETNSLAKLLET